MLRIGTRIAFRVIFTRCQVPTPMQAIDRFVDGELNDVDGTGEHEFARRSSLVSALVPGTKKLRRSKRKIRASAKVRDSVSFSPPPSPLDSPRKAPRTIPASMLIPPGGPLPSASLPPAVPSVGIVTPAAPKRSAPKGNKPRQLPALTSTPAATQAGPMLSPLNLARKFLLSGLVLAPLPVYHQ